MFFPPVLFLFHSLFISLFSSDICFKGKLHMIQYIQIYIIIYILVMSLFCFLFSVFCCHYIESYFHDLIKSHLTYERNIYTLIIIIKKKKKRKTYKDTTRYDAQTNTQIEFKCGRKRRNMLKNHWYRALNAYQEFCWY